MRFLRFFLKGFVTLLAFIVTYVLLVPFLWSPIYDFDPPKPFSGSHFYNPYKDIDSNNWFKANFHAHANVLGGITNGRVNSPKKIVATYSSIGYKIHSVSNYMNINYLEKDSENFIPGYEHGYSPFKFHQVIIGAKKVFPFDFPLFQTVSNKQYIINQLRPTCDIFAIAHPEFQNGYDSSDIVQLTGFRLLEVLNQQKNSFSRWDDALSVGNCCFLIGDDDVHNLNHHQDYGVSVTLINAPKATRKEVIKALKEGRTAGYEPWVTTQETLERKIKDRNRIAAFTSFKVSEKGVISFRVNKAMRSIQVIGQNGTIKNETTFQDSATDFQWNFTSKDTYIRFNIVFQDEDKMYSNPVFRYDGKKIYERKAHINYLKTTLYRGGAWLLLFFALYFGIKKYKSKKR